MSVHLDSNRSAVPVSSNPVSRTLSRIGSSIQNGANSVLNFVLPRNPVTQCRELRIIPTCAENALGSLYYDNMCPKRKVSTDVEMTQTIEGIFNKLVDKCVRKNELKFEVRFMEDDKTVNAFCLPGGKIVITTAMIKKLQEGVPNTLSPEEQGRLSALSFEDKVAAVLGHEISHACAGHGRRSMQLGLISVLVLKVATFAAGYFIKRGQLAQIEKEKQKRIQENRPMTRAEEIILVRGVEEKSTIFNKVMDFVNIIIQFMAAQKHSRCHELEADKYGIKLAVKAGYQAQGAVWLQHKFMEMKKEKEGVKRSFFQRVFSSAKDLFSSHPPSEERLQANRATVETIDRHGLEAIYPTA